MLFDNIYVTQVTYTYKTKTLCELYTNFSFSHTYNNVTKITAYKYY